MISANNLLSSIFSVVSFSSATVGGIWLRSRPQSLREKYETQGLDVIKDGTEVSTLKEKLESNKGLLMDIAPFVINTDKKDSEGRNKNALSFKIWCRKKLQLHPKEVGIAEELKIRSLCVINKKK